MATQITFPNFSNYIIYSTGMVFNNKTNKYLHREKYELSELNIVDIDSNTEIRPKTDYLYVSLTRDDNSK